VSQLLQASTVNGAAGRGLTPKVRVCWQLLWCAGIATGLLQSWAFRHSVRSDGVSYLDIARACSHGDWQSLVNGYWSPLYPFLLGGVFYIVKPSFYWESTIAHLANFGIFVISFACFEQFVKMLAQSQRKESNSPDETERMPEWALWILGDTLFIYFSLLFIGMDRIQPDLCVAALVYLAAAFLLRIRRGDDRWTTYAGFGATLGAAYLAKAIMFPLAFVFLGCALLVRKPLSRAVPRTALALVIFLLVSAPFILALSEQKGRLTFGDVGRIAYAEFVDGATRHIHWQGEPVGTGIPVHPTRMLMVSPPLFEFATPPMGTYPPWYDPSYWYEGIVAKFNLRNQLRAVRYTIEEYAGILPYMSGVFVGFLGMALFARSDGSFGKGFFKEWPIWVPAAAALGLYGLVYVEARYVAPFFVLIWMSLFAGLRFPRSSVAQAFVRTLTLAMGLMFGMGIMWLAGRSLFRALQPLPFVNWQVAEGLREIGLQPGDRVASIGFALEGYWAHLAGLKIIAEIPLGGVASFWTSPAQIQSEAFADFAQAGAKVVVTDQALPPGSAEGWQEIGGTGYFAHRLDGIPSVPTKRGTGE